MTPAFYILGGLQIGVKQLSIYVVLFQERGGEHARHLDQERNEI